MLGRRPVGGWRVERTEWGLHLVGSRRESRMYHLHRREGWLARSVPEWRHPVRQCGRQFEKFGPMLTANQNGGQGVRRLDQRGPVPETTKRRGHLLLKVHWWMTGHRVAHRWPMELKSAYHRHSNPLNCLRPCVCRHHRLSLHASCRPQRCPLQHLPLDCWAVPQRRCKI